jgi:protein gp37
MDPAWVIRLRDQCQADGVPFFIKQWGGAQKSKHG